MIQTKTKEEWYEEYMSYRDVYGYKRPANDFVRCFLNRCLREYPHEVYLTQEMLDQWYVKRPTEQKSSHAQRVRNVNNFIKFINTRGDGPYVEAEYDAFTVPVEPVLFTKTELANFFKAVDEVPYGSIYTVPGTARLALLRAIEIPVVFRLLYSTGMRVNEVRWLKREDVDLERGIIHIRRSKGIGERVVAMHHTMKTLVKEYMKRIVVEMPDTDILFPGPKGNIHNSAWIRTNFKKLWYKYNPKPPKGERQIVAYALRHNYAVENIMSWNQDGYNADKRLVALSKSMGHTRVESTQYYFHLVPRFADILEELEGRSVEEIIPNE